MTKTPPKKKDSIYDGANIRQLIGLALILIWTGICSTLSYIWSAPQTIVLLVYPLPLFFATFVFSTSFFTKSKSSAKVINTAIAALILSLLMIALLYYLVQDA